MNLDEYFQNLKDDGTVDSSGVFTLDPAKVEWKLARYQLANRKHYPLFLLKAAFAAKAPCLNVEFDKGFLSSKRCVRFTIPGFEVSEVQLKSATLGRGQMTEELSFLVVALTAARGLGKVRLLSPGVNLTVEGEEVSFQPPLDDSPAETLFEVSGEELEEPYELLVERSRWSLIPLSFLPEELRWPVRASEIHQATLTAAIGPGYHSRKLDSAVRWGRTLDMAQAPDLYMLCWFDQRRAKNYGVHRGVTHELSLELPEGFQVVMNCDDLKMDLSYSSFVQDAAFEEKKQRVNELIALLLEEVVGWDVAWSEEDVERINAQVKAFWRDGADSEKLRRFYETAITDHFPLQPPGVESMLSKLSDAESDHQIDLCLRKYRHEVVETRSYYVSTALAWVQEEVEFRRATGRDWHEADTIKRLLDYLFFKKDVKWNNWRCHPFLSLLESYIQMADISDDGAGAMDDIHESWLVPLRLFYARSKVQDFEVFKLLCLLEEARMEEALELAERSVKAPFAPVRCVWFNLILDFYSGKLSWLQHVRLRAKASLLSNKRERQLLKRRRYMKPKQFEEWALYHGIFEEGFWVLAAYYTCSCWRHGHTPHRFWCKVLLQAAIGYPGEEGTLAENLARPLRLPLLAPAR